MSWIIFFSFHTNVSCESDPKLVKSILEKFYISSSLLQRLSAVPLHHLDSCVVLLTWKQCDVNFVNHSSPEIWWWPALFIIRARVVCSQAYQSLNLCYWHDGHITSCSDSVIPLLLSLVSFPPSLPSSHFNHTHTISLPLTSSTIILVSKSNHKTMRERQQRGTLY